MIEQEGHRLAGWSREPAFKPSPTSQISIDSKEQPILKDRRAEIWGEAAAISSRR